MLTAKRQFVFAGLVILIASLLLILVPVIAQDATAEQSNMQQACTLETIHGTWVFEARGVVVEEETVRVYAEAGTWTLDGEGSATGTLSASIDGEPFARTEDFTATYEHVTGCVYRASDAFGLEFDLYATPDGAIMTYFSPSFTGTMFRQ